LNSKPKSTVLFQGDSITYADRRPDINEGLGEGYVMMTAAWLSAAHPEYGARFINRGISGNRIRDLKARWKKDCTDLKPDLVSILIGINDAVDKPFWKKPTPQESFRQDYEYILEQTRLNPKTRIVIMEPFLLASNENYRETKANLEPIIEITRELAKKFNTLYIPLNEIFEKAANANNPHYWAIDGAHPTLAGHALIAQTWIKEVMETDYIFKNNK